MTSRKIPESAVENLVSDLEGKANVANTVTTDAAQTISAGKKISIGGTAAYGRPFEIMMPTSTESNPTENKAREIAFLASEGAGEWYEGSLTHSRSTTGESYTGLRAGRLVNGTYKEGALGVRITADGTTFGTAPTPPANSAGNVIVTAGWVRNACLLPGEIIIWSTSTPPAGYLICNGAAISRTTYANLFHVIGTTWGAGDGSTTFNVPNFVDRYPVGVGSLGAVGTLLNQGLPNITGSCTAYELGVYQGNTQNGALGITASAQSGSSGHGSQAININLDASKSNGIYGASDRVQPFSSVVCFCIKY